MTHPPRSRLALVAALAVLLGACGDRPPRAESPEARFQRMAAYRQACASRLLAERADDDVETLERAVANIDPGPMAEINRRATGAALDFGRAYQRHAELRASAYAYLDSAVNHARTSADSARYLERASTFSIRAPAEGTVEANVLSSYQANLSALIADLDHPCNWDFPF